MQTELVVSLVLSLEVWVFLSDVCGNVAIFWLVFKIFMVLMASQQQISAGFTYVAYFFASCFAWEASVFVHYIPDLADLFWLVRGTYDTSR